jgi:hypothetical protein
MRLCTARCSNFSARRGPHASYAAVIKSLNESSFSGSIFTTVVITQKTSRRYAVFTPQARMRSSSQQITSHQDLFSTMPIRFIDISRITFRRRDADGATGTVALPKALRLSLQNGSSVPWFRGDNGWRFVCRNTCCCCINSNRSASPSSGWLICCESAPSWRSMN